MSNNRPWLGLRDLCSRYGNIVHMMMGRQHMIILDSPDVIFELLDKRSANTSCRVFTPTMDLTNLFWNVGFMPYGQAWRVHRRIFTKHFHPDAIREYQPTQIAISRKFLARLADPSTDLKLAIRYTVAAAIMKIVYGIDAKDEHDPTIDLIAAAIDAVTPAVVPGSYLVDALPFLRYVPAWFPGAGFQKQFATFRKSNDRIQDVPYSLRKVDGDNGAGGRPLVDLMLSQSEGYADAEGMVKRLGAVAFFAGSDTSYSSLQTFFLAMSLYPDIQRKAQDELDAVVGPDRLPTFADRDSLVYVNAIVKETLRWFNVSPLGISHRTMEDDEFRGYFIPADSVLVANVWACLHDPEEYGDADVYRPERYIREGRIDPNVRDPSDFIFGFGRRICPGKYFAEAAIFINIASVLHVFDITPPLDHNGQPIKIHPRMSDGLVSYPEDCRCTIRLRSEKAAALIRTEESR
ncbi:O-methylsterigmatocystin oxidoreductase [Earliella scabrosa]|nr:O-methylsterigmatocystin oxidoreductase [Earliella scabrosa]